MELAGDEKRIQALFSELSREDAQAAPRFEKLWREAALAEQTPRLRRSLVPVVAAAAATVIVAITVLFVAWSRERRDKSPIEQNAQNVAPLPSESQPQAREPENREPDNKVTQRRTPSHAPRRRTLSRRRPQEPALEQQAAMLANWKSPTAKFMTAPTGSVFSSLPQLNESVKDLQSFLSKESIQ
jgi:hypothetical protein